MKALKGLQMASAVGLIAACSGTPAPQAVTAGGPSAPDGDEQTFATIQGRCLAVERSRYPVGCQIDIDQEVVRMQLTMADRDAAEQYTDAAFNDVAQPFCQLALREGQAAVVIQALHDERQMRVADCANGRFSDWEPVDREAQELVAAARACEAVEASDAPIGCGMGEVNGRPSLVVSYASRAITDQDWAALSQRLSVPFCQGMSAAGVEAFVYLIEDKTRAKGFNCVTEAQTAWQPIQKDAGAQRKAVRDVHPVWHTIGQ